MSAEDRLAGPQASAYRLAVVSHNHMSTQQQQQQQRRASVEFRPTCNWTSSSSPATTGPASESSSYWLARSRPLWLGGTATVYGDGSAVMPARHCQSEPADCRPRDILPPYYACDAPQRVGFVSCDVADTRTDRVRSSSCVRTASRTEPSCERSVVSQTRRSYTASSTSTSRQQRQLGSTVGAAELSSSPCSSSSSSASAGRHRRVRQHHHHHPLQQQQQARLRPVRATAVRQRTEYHVSTASAYPPSAAESVSSSSVRRRRASVSQRPITTSSSSSWRADETRCCASLWLGVAKIEDVRPLCDTVRLTTAQQFHGERCHGCSGALCDRAAPAPAAAAASDSSCAVVTAGDRLYHQHCFHCNVCKRRLGVQGRRFCRVGQQVYCEADYKYVGFRMYADTCVVCSDAINDYVLRAMGRSYHVDCFRCAVCHATLSDQPFTVDINSAVHCVNDYIRMYAPKCAVCHDAIIPRTQSETVVKRLVVGDRNYHQHCLRCQDCGVVLTDEGAQQQQQQRQQSIACYMLDNRLLCLHCHTLRRRQAISLAPPPLSAVAAAANTTYWPYTYYPADVTDDVIWPVGGVSGEATTERGVAYGQQALFVDVTLDGDASSTCTSDSAADDVTASSSDDVTSCSDVSEGVAQAGPAGEAAGPGAGQQQQSGTAPSIDSGHCSAASDDTMTSSDTETLDAGTEPSDVDDDDGDDLADDVDVTSASDSQQTLCAVPRHSSSSDSGSSHSQHATSTASGVSSASTPAGRAARSSSLTILDLLADSSRVTDL